MEDGDTEKYHVSSLIQDFVFASRKMGCIRCVSSQVYNKRYYVLLFQYVWVLYCDLLCLDYDGNVTDACVLALLAAFKNSKIILFVCFDSLHPVNNLSV